MNLPESKDPVDRLHRALHELPDVRAPRTLEERVFAELAARAARPWWRQSVAAWPMPARIALIAACLAVATGLTQLLAFGVRDSTEATRGIETWLAPVANGWTALQTVGSALAGAVALVPSLWLFVLAATVAAGAALIGGCIAAYRSLCVSN